jgi:hypothetical protein
MMGFHILFVGMCCLEYRNLIHCEINEIFLGRQPRQDVKVFCYFGNTNTKPPEQPEGGDGVPETSENFHILTRLSARENSIEFCCRESFKSCSVSCASVGVGTEM